MTDSPWMILIVFAGACYLAKLWRDDLLAWRADRPNPRALPGATPAPAIALWIGGIGALFLVLLETGGELALGVDQEQTKVTGILLFAMIGAGVLEEIIFRGYLVVTSRGKTVLILSIIGFSLLFALLHYQYYSEIPENGSWRDFHFVLSPKAAWSLSLLFLNSLWFYTLRFFRWNPHHSLLPCFVAHIASNIAVFCVKLAQGHVTGLF